MDHITLSVISEYGCVDTITKRLSIISDIIFYAPNTFTPDDNEFNQNWIFYVDGVDSYNFNLTIYNRWGQIVWETNNINSSWDGTYNGIIVQDGVYNWISTVKSSNSDFKTSFSGFINVLR